MKMFFIALLIPLLNFSQEYPYRDISKPIFSLNENEKILQCSPERNGSTLIFNVLHYLFEDTLGLHDIYSPRKKVIKTHHAGAYIGIGKNYDVYCVSTIRNPLDALGSYFQFTGAAVTKISLDGLLQSYIYKYNSIKYLERNLPKDRFLRLKYESFANDRFDYIFDELEAFFSIVIDQDEKEKIVTWFCKSAMNQNAGKHTNHINWDDVTGLHGNHITNSSWRQVIPKKFHSYVLNKLKPVMDDWGYLPRKV